MPEISRFYGIIITMYGREHNPPHFHSAYDEYEAMIDIDSAEIIEGELPKKPVRLIQAWVELHKEELMLNWKEHNKDFPDIKKIEPLK